MTSFLQDLRHGLRALTRRPGFAIAAVATLAVGIGANTTVFSIVNAMLLRPLPFGERSGRIVTLHATHQLQPEDWGWGHSELSYRDLVDLRSAGAFEGIGGHVSRNLTLSGEASAERVQGGSVTPDLFALLGVQPMLGRTFVDEDATDIGLESAVILTHGLWQRRYGADPGIVGRSILVNERARTVVGVMPPGFKFPERDEIYLPVRLDEAPRTSRNVNAVGVLAAGVSLERAQDEASAVAARLAADHPDTNRGYGVRVLPFRTSQVDGPVRQVAAALMAAVVFVLLIVCANLANLSLVRGAARQREVAVRAAVGASRARLVAVMLAESVLLSTAGAALGILASQWALDFMRQSFPEELPYWMRFDIDLRIALFSAGAAIFTTIAIGLLPALRASRPNLVNDLNESGRGISLGRRMQQLQSGLAVAQVALCLALLVGAVLMIRSFLALQSADLGFDHRPLLTLRGYLAGDRFDDVRTRAAFFQQAADRLRALPGVAAAAATTTIPGDDGGEAVRVVVDGRPSTDEDTGASAIGTTGHLFDTLGVRLLEGRTFTEAEIADPDAEVAILNQALARRLWPGSSAVDRRIGFRGPDRVQWFRVIGVAPDVQYEEIGEESALSRLNVYLPYARGGARTMAFLMRTTGDPAALAGPARDGLRELHAGFPVYELMPMTERRRFTTWEQRFFGQMMGAFAGIALFLSCVGVYALLSYAVRRRTQEMGVRLALGASPRDVMTLFVLQGGVVGALGLVCGLALALIVARGLSRTLWGVDGFDPALFASAGAALMATVIFASYWPARRAANADPMAALRVE